MDSLPPFSLVMRRVGKVRSELSRMPTVRSFNNTNATRAPCATADSIAHQPMRYIQRQRKSVKFLRQDFIPHPAVGDRTREFLGVHRVWKSEVDAAGVVEGFDLIGCEC